MNAQQVIEQEVEQLELWALQGEVAGFGPDAVARLHARAAALRRYLSNLYRFQAETREKIAGDRRPLSPEEECEDLSRTLRAWDRAEIAEQIAPEVLEAARRMTQARLRQLRAPDPA